MDQEEETFATWNKVAVAYQARFMDLALYNDTYDFFCAAVPHDRARILDVGCGPGNITRYLLAKRPHFQVDGIDVAPNMVRLAQQNNPGARFKVMDARHLARLPTPYHGIICGFCVPYLSWAEAAQLISDASGLLLDKGVLYLSFVDGDPSQSGFQVGSSGDRVYFYYHSSHALIAALESNHLRVLKVVDLEYVKTEGRTEIHTIIIAQKRGLSPLSGS